MQADVLLTHRDRLVECVLQPAHERSDRLLVVDRDDDDELAAPDAADRVLGAQHRGEAAGHLTQDRVAGGVPQVEVDLTEVVEVDVAHHHLTPVAPPARQRLGQPVQQEELVGQARVGIGHGELPELVVLPAGAARPAAPAGAVGPRE